MNLQPREKAYKPKSPIFWLFLNKHTHSYNGNAQSKCLQSSQIYYKAKTWLKQWLSLLHRVQKIKREFWLQFLYLQGVSKFYFLKTLSTGILLSRQLGRVAMPLAITYFTHDGKYLFWNLHHCNDYDIGKLFNEVWDKEYVHGNVCVYLSKGVVEICSKIPVKRAHIYWGWVILM